MSTETTTDIKHALPRSTGTWRPVANIKPGWWVHLETTPEAPEGTPSGWEQVSVIADTNRGNRILVFEGTVDGDDGNALTAHKTEQAVTLTEREARKHGLGVEG